MTNYANRFYKLIPERAGRYRHATPRMLHDAYRNGQLFGVIADDENFPWYVRRAAQYDQAYCNAQMDDDIIWERSKLGNRFQGAGKGRRLMYHQNYVRRSNKAGVGAQLTGDCVSWALRFILELLRIQNIYKGRWEEWYIRQATCGLYSGRGHTGQGANPTLLTRYAIKIGTLFEDVYLNGKYDFRDYANYVNWGISHGNVGMPAELLEETKPFHAKEYRIITTTEGLRDAWAAGEDELDGCQIHCGSSIGVTDSGNPISQLSGSWSHDMGMAGFDDTREFYHECVFPWDQSWGNWNEVTNIPEPWKPITQGMFFLAESSMPAALRAQETCAVFGFEGKPAAPSNILF